MPTVAQIISDIEVQLLQANPSDDSALDWGITKYWIGYHLNALVTAECNSKIARGEMIPAVYVRSVTCQVPEEEDLDCGDDCQDRVFVELDGVEILTLNDDRGVLRLTTDEGDQILKASVETLSFLQNVRFAKPSANNLVYVRQGNKFYIEGLKPADVPFEEVNIWYVPKQDVYTMADTAEVLVSDLVLPQLVDSVVAKGKQTLYGTQTDTSNNGTPDLTPVYHRQISNPDQPQPEA